MSIDGTGRTVAEVAHEMAKAHVEKIEKIIAEAKRKAGAEAQIIEVMARAECISDGHDPDQETYSKAYGFPKWREYEEKVTAALAALKASGLAIVPVEPTDDMIESGQKRVPGGFDLKIRRECAVNIYRAMIGKV